MPFARVGAMPQPIPNDQRNAQPNSGGGASSRQKGITMEDLKKQTAVRLAQEQQQQGMLPESSAAQGILYPEPTHRDRPFRPLSEHQLHGYPRASYHPARVYPEQHAYQNHHAPPPSIGMHAPHGARHNYYPQPQPTYQQPPQQQPHHIASVLHPVSYENRSTTNGPPSQYYENQSGNPLRTQHIQPQIANTVNSVPRSPDDGHLQDQGPRFQRSGSAELDSSSNQSASNQSKQKLPHGLTVHELKEMTKARLQAEASDTHEGDVENKRVSPLDFDSVPEVRERAMSHDSARRSNHVLLHRGNASDSMTSIPSLVQVNQQSRDQHSGRQPQVSPLPPGFQTFGPTNTMSHHAETVMHRGHPVPGRDPRLHQMKLEAWETGSVASHNSTVLSENLGSESAISSGFGSGILQTDNELCNMPFNRSLSYSAGQLPSDTSNEDRSHPPSGTASPGGNVGFGFDPSMGYNRRRACTLSPRSKPGLIHEDRPHYDGQELVVPNFSSASRSNLRVRSRNNYSPVLQVGLDHSLFGQNHGMVPLGDDLNRPRTSSAASLPPIAHTVEEFNRDRANTFSGFSTNNPRLHGDGLPGNMPSSLSEGLLGFSLPSNGREEPGAKHFSSNVFREGPALQGRVSAPPGFSSGLDSSSSFGHSAAFSRVGSVDSVNDPHVSTDWGGGSNTSSLFSSGGVDELATGMGSILKLSGATDRPDRERSNTYPHTSKTDSCDYFTADFYGKTSGPSAY